jgi:hypothetical protein
LAIKAGAEDDTHMHILSVLIEFGNVNSNPTFGELLEHVHTVKTHLELCLSALSDKGYIETVSTSWRDLYFKNGYKITDRGRQAFDLYIHRAKYFISSLMETYRQNDKEALYRLVMENRALLWFGYSRKLITKQEVEKIAETLDTTPIKLWRFDGTDGTTNYLGPTW